MQDAQDDLKAAAADVLLAVVDKLPALEPSQQQKLHAALWEALPDADDLSACTSRLPALTAALRAWCSQGTGLHSTTMQVDGKSLLWSMSGPDQLTYRSMHQLKSLRICPRRSETSEQCH